MRKTLTALSALVLALGMGIAFGASSDKANSKAAQAETKKAPSFMFVVSAKKAHLKIGKDGNTLLVIKKSDLNKVIQFSDRPRRIVEDTTASVLAKDWPEGENSFAADPPNAVLSGVNLKPQIVVIKGMSIYDGTATLKLAGKIHLDESVADQMVIKAPIITIDGSAHAQSLKQQPSHVRVCTVGACLYPNYNAR